MWYSKGSENLDGVNQMYHHVKGIWLHASHEEKQNVTFTFSFLGKELSTFLLLNSNQL